MTCNPASLEKGFDAKPNGPVRQNDEYSAKIKPRGNSHLTQNTELFSIAVTVTSTSDLGWVLVSWSHQKYYILTMFYRLFLIAFQPYQHLSRVLSTAKGRCYCLQQSLLSKKFLPIDSQSYD